MEQVVIDTNIVIKLFIKEEYSDSAIRLKESYLTGNVEVIVNSLMKYEFINVLKYKGFTSEKIKLALTAIEDYDFQTEEFTSQLTTLTTDVAIVYNISSYDASYVALASLLGCKLYTADEKLIKKLKNLKFVKHIKEFA